MGEQTEEQATEQITVEFGDTQGHAYVAPEDAQRILEALGNKPDGDRLGIRFSLGDDDDVEGHAQSRFVTVLAGPLDDDTEGHAISLHFPTTHDADAFRRRLLATGVITGALIIGGVGIALQPAATGSLATPQAGSVSRSAQVTQLQQAAQYQREQRLQKLQEVAPAAPTSVSQAPTGRPATLQQQAQLDREEALMAADETSAAPAGGAAATGGTPVGNQVPHGGPIR